jgi:ABC-2 type transport system permease protein
MNRPLRKKYFAESWLMLLAIAVGVFVFCWFRVWVVSELDTAQFRQIIDLLPKDWRKFSPVDFDWLVSYLGRTSLTLDEPMLVMLVTGWVMIRGSDVVSGELSRGTLEMLLSQPVSRHQVFVTHAVWTMVCLLGLVLLAWLGMSLGIWTTSVVETTYPELRVPIADYRIPLRFLAPQTATIAMASVVNPVSFLPGLVNLFCLGVFFGGFAAMCSAVDRYRWRTLGIVIGFYFANAGLKLLGMASEKLTWVTHVTVFGFYSPASAIEQAQQNPWSPWWIWERNLAGETVGTGSLFNCILLLGLGCLFYVIGCRVFSQRDLPAPM